MKPKILVTALAVSLAALLGSDAAQAGRAAQPAAPFGFLNGVHGGDNAVQGLAPLTGWALARDGVDAVDIVVDGIIVGRANYGRARPRVAVLYPGFPDSAAAGFAYELDTTHFLNGVHTVTARVQSNAGKITYLSGVDLEFSNTTHDLVPFGKIEFPNPGAEMQGNCGSRFGFFSVVSGYALDAGVADYDTGVAYVELLVDRSLMFNSIADCHFSRAEGGNSNCYGLRRLDIETNFPSLKDSPHSGFRFVLDVGKLLGDTGAGQPGVFPHPPQYNPGAHLLTIRAGDVFEQVSIVAEVPVTFTCIDFTQNDNSIGQITYPIQGLLYNGTILVNGWALDLDGVQTVIVLVDGNPVGTANLGFPRPGIRSLYPSYPDSPAPGWVFSLDTTKFSNGQHEISAVVIDNTGADTDIGRFKITVANPIP